MKSKKSKTQHREEFQKKKVKPQKSMRGLPETEYGEIKKISSFSLTPTAVERLKSISRDLQISTSELIERFARGKFYSPSTEQTESSNE